MLGLAASGLIVAGALFVPATALAGPGSPLGGGLLGEVQHSVLSYSCSHPAWTPYAAKTVQVQQVIGQAADRRAAPG